MPVSGDGPNRLWVADITYVPTAAGFLFLAVVLDAWSRRVVGWAMATHLRTELVMAACTKSQNKNLFGIVTVALETGLRKGELLGLTWDRVDLSRGVMRLELTKSGKRREVPMRQVVYDILAGLPEKREGRVWPSADIRTAFENAVREAKLDDFRFHDTRHHFASWFVMRGGASRRSRRFSVPPRRR